MDDSLVSEDLGWESALSEQSSMQQLDSVEFLESAFGKLLLYRERGRTAASPEALRKHIGANPTADILGMLSIVAPWAALGPSIGVCEFRRTWSHSITVDFLAVHPALLTPRKLISGVGTALLYCVGSLAHEIGAEKIWLETTDLSVNYYSRLFGTPDTSDLAVIPTELFYDSLKRRFTGSSQEASS